MNKVLSKVCPGVVLGASIKSAWDDVVGVDLSKLSELTDVKLHRDGELAVFIEVLSSAAVLLRCNLPQIVSNIVKITGFQNTRVVVHQTLALRNDTKNAA